MDLKAFVYGRAPRARTAASRGSSRRAAGQAADRGHRGLRRGRRLRDRARLRPDRRRASNARLGIPEVKRGLVAAGGALRLLPRCSPLRWRWSSRSPATDHRGARRGARPGEPPRRARRGVDAALELAAEVAANAPLSIAASKSILNAQGSWDDETFWAKQGEIVAPVFTSEDAIEGSTAFREKRAPNWRGR